MASWIRWNVERENDEVCVRALRRETQTTVSEEVTFSVLEAFLSILKIIRRADISIKPNVSFISDWHWGAPKLFTCTTSSYLHPTPVPPQTHPLGRKSEKTSNDIACKGSRNIYGWVWVKKLTIKAKVNSFVITIILTHLAHFNGLLQPIPVQMVSII